MGIHFGDVILNKVQAFGEGVTLAMELESLGQGGNILVSNRIHHEIRNDSELQTIALGTYSFKNIDHQVEVYALNQEGLVVPDQQSLTRKPTTETWPASRKKLITPVKSITVLPLVNMSNDPD